MQTEARALGGARALGEARALGGPYIYQNM